MEGPSFFRQKVFLIGFPKSGTSSITKALESLGYRCAHWKYKDKFVGEMMRDAVAAGLAPVARMPDIDAFTQMDFVEEEGTYWPQISLLDSLCHHYPDAKFILNWRDLDATLASMAKWPPDKPRPKPRPKMLERLMESDLPSMTHGPPFSEEEIRGWMERHWEHCKEVFGESRNFLIFDIVRDDPENLKTFLGVAEKAKMWWGVANSLTEEKAKIQKLMAAKLAAKEKAIRDRERRDKARANRRKGKRRRRRK